VFAHHRGYWKTGLIVALLLAMGTTLSAPSDPQKTKVFTLEEAVEFALKNYPAVRASLERVRAAQAGVGVAANELFAAHRPSVASNRATDNNITGLTIPNSVIAPSLGRCRRRLQTAALGKRERIVVLLGAARFGYRGREWTRRGRRRAARRRKLRSPGSDVSVATVNAYLTLLAAEQTLRAARADVERRETFAKSVHVLVD